LKIGLREKPNSSEMQLIKMKRIYRHELYRINE
jgi:hypothetical protein